VSYLNDLHQLYREYYSLNETKNVELYTPLLAAKQYHGNITESSCKFLAHSAVSLLQFHLEINNSSLFIGPTLHARNIFFTRCKFCNIFEHTILEYVRTQNYNFFHLYNGPFERVTITTKTVKCRNMLQN
jgi:hypothetical protein